MIAFIIWMYTFAKVLSTSISLLLCSNDGTAVYTTPLSVPFSFGDGLSSVFIP